MNQLHQPTIYPITSGNTTNSTSPESQEFRSILELVQAAANAQLPYIQIREKKLTARVLFELTRQATQIALNSTLKVLVNDRFDIAISAGAQGVHLTSQSLTTEAVRKLCGDDFVIGVSTHSLDQVRRARDEGANFAVFGPVFETASKICFGPPQGLEQLASVVRHVQGFPVLALGGVAIDNLADCFRAGASGVAGIGLFDNRDRVENLVLMIRRAYDSLKQH
jgi:thiamine-phosphate pyrophosphorylase